LRSFETFFGPSGHYEYVRLKSASGDGPDGESRTADFARLYDRHAQAVYKFCARRSADLALAEDLTSSTFLEVWRHRDRAPLGELDSALPWLLGVANNVVRNALRGNRRARAVIERLPRPAVAIAAEDYVVARAETETALRAALAVIAALSEEEREVVMLVLWSELSYEEAAIALGIPGGTVRSRLARARSKLQTALGNPVQSALKETS
jgi:RNA polymerase sigma factor (sigma-70 family)